MVYVSRSTVNARGVENEPEVLSAVRAAAAEHGLPVEVIASPRPLPETVRLFASAAVVLGPHGSGLANAAFCAEGAALFELGLEGTSGLVFYSHLAAALGLRYRYITADPAKKGDTASGLRGAMLANASAVAAAVRSALQT